jgi:PEP-CTERM/exosortase A-associated glycosyltransferase
VKVLHVLDHSLPLQSGYVYRTMAILRAQKAMGLDPVCVTSPKQGQSPAGAEEMERFRFYRAESETRFARVPVVKEALLMRALTNKLAAVANVEHPDLIHAHSPTLNGIPARRVARTFRVPFVYEIRAFWEDAAVDHGTTREGSLRYRLTRASETWLCKRADAVVTICEGLRKDLIGRGIDASKIHVVPNGVDPSRFEPRPADPALRARLGLNGGPVLGFIGSFYRYEGLDVLVDAMTEIRRVRPDARLVLVGGGEVEEELKAQVEDRGLGKTVHFAGRVPQSETAAYYSVMDLLVYPRRSMRLTELVTPLKPLEAMALGKAVVGSDIGGIRELVENGVTGRLVSAGDVRSLARVCASVIEDREEMREMGKRARERAIGERAWGNIVKTYLDIYASAGAEGGSLGERGSRK